MKSIIQIYIIILLSVLPLESADPAVSPAAPPLKMPPPPLILPPQPLLIAVAAGALFAVALPTDALRAAAVLSVAALSSHEALGNMPPLP